MVGVTELTGTSIQLHHTGMGFAPGTVTRLQLFSASSVFFCKYADFGAFHWFLCMFTVNKESFLGVLWWFRGVDQKQKN